MVYLSLWYGVFGTALSWFSSYLTDRQQRVKIADCLSTSLPTSCVIPQGSWTISLHSLHYSVKLSNPVISWITTLMQMIHKSTFLWLRLTLIIPLMRDCLQIRDCLQDNFHRMNDSKLRLNTDKTEFLINGT